MIRPLKDARQFETGASAILVAVTMLVLMGFAAIVVDGGAAFNERRQDQSGADVGVLAATQFTEELTFDAAKTAAETEAIRITYETVKPDMTFAEWNTAFATCTDSNKPARFTETAGSDCVSFTFNLQEARVRTPTIDVDTTFGRLLGANAIQTSAVAEAKTIFPNPGGVLPFGLPDTAANDGEICLKSSSNPKNVEPCDGPDEGNFGSLDISLYGNTEDPFNTPLLCGNTSTNKKLVINISVGADHGMAEHPNGSYPTGRHDFDGCNNFNSNLNFDPDVLPTQTGIGSNLDKGLVEGGYGYPGRLTRPSSGTDTVQIRSGFFIDDTPLWFYLNSLSSGDAPASCLASITEKAQMVSCLEDYKTGYNPSSPFEPLFDESIEFNPRFAWVPQSWLEFLSDDKDHPIKAFRPVYVQTLLVDCTANDCALVYDPGETPAVQQGKCASFPCASNTDVEAVSALLMIEEMLPESIRVRAPGTPEQTAYNLSR